jgi:hypothetical protein
LRSGGAIFANGEGFEIGAPVDNVHLAPAPRIYRARGELIIRACPQNGPARATDWLEWPGPLRNIQSPWTNPALFEDPLGEWRDSFERTPLPHGRHRQAKGGPPVGWAARGAG